MMTHRNDDMLDELFAQARADHVTPPDDLVARVLADAASVQAGRAAAEPPVRQGLWARTLDTIGGWPAVGGLATAGLVGLWIGVAPPDAVEDFAAPYLGDAVHVNILSADWDLVAGEFEDG